MKTVTIPKQKLVNVMDDVEKLISDFEDIINIQDQTARQRLNDIRKGKIQPKTEKELDSYLKKRGIKID